MDKFTKSLLEAIINHGGDDLKADALEIVALELERVTALPVAASVVASAAPAWVATAPTPVAPVVAAVAAPVMYEDVVEQEQEDELADEHPLALSADKHSAYIEIYGAGNFLLLDEEDEIEVGDEWIIKPEEVTNRARTWRTTNDIGHSVGEYRRSHYRRAI